MVARHPIFVVVTKGLNRLETVHSLDGLGISSYATDPHTVEEIITSSKTLSDVLGVPEAGASVAGDMRRRLAELQQRLGALTPKRVLFVVWTQPLISVGKDLFIADALRRAGAVSIVDAEQAWPQVSLEEVARLQPDFLVFSASHADAVYPAVEALAALPGWSIMDAVSKRRIAVIGEAVNRPAPALGRDLLRVLFGQSTQTSSDYGLIVVNIRLPRILLGIIVGASLSVAGTSFQALLRNPLADPYVLGVSSGASLGAILALIAEPHLTLSPLLAALLTPLGAFLGAAATIAAVYFLGRREGQIDSTTLLLGGVITGSFISAIIMFMMSTLSGSLRGISFWLMGDLSTPLQKSIYWFLGIGFIVAAGAIYTTASDLNLLLAGEKEAMHLGVDVPRVRLVVYIAASLLTVLAVSVSGAIGYVGLIVPHVMRLVFGSEHPTLLPTAAIRGALALVFAAQLARTVA